MRQGQGICSYYRGLVPSKVFGLTGLPSVSRGTPHMRFTRPRSLSSKFFPAFQDVPRKLIRTIISSESGLAPNSMMPALEMVTKAANKARKTAIFFPYGSKAQRHCKTRACQALSVTRLSCEGHADGLGLEEVTAYQSPYSRGRNSCASGPQRFATVSSCGERSETFCSYQTCGGEVVRETPQVSPRIYGIS